MAFMAPLMSLVAERVRSVGVVSGAPRLCRSSAVFVEPFLRIIFPFGGFSWFLNSDKPTSLRQAPVGDQSQEFPLACLLPHHIDDHESTAIARPQGFVIPRKR